MIGQGRESTKAYFAEHKKEYAALEKEIWAKVKKGIPQKPKKETNSESEDDEILESVAAV